MRYKQEELFRRLIDAKLDPQLRPSVEAQKELFQDLIKKGIAPRALGSILSANKPYFAIVWRWQRDRDKLDNAPKLVSAMRKSLRLALADFYNEEPRHPFKISLTDDFEPNFLPCEPAAGHTLVDQDRQPIHGKLGEGEFQPSTTVETADCTGVPPAETPMEHSGTIAESFPANENDEEPSVQEVGFASSTDINLRIAPPIVKGLASGRNPAAGISSPCQIDVASTPQLVSLFRKPDLETAISHCDWYWASSKQVTVQVLDAPNVRFGLTRNIGALGPFEELSNGLASIVGEKHRAQWPNQKSDYDGAFKETVSWAISHKDVVKHAYDSLRTNDATRFNNWSDDLRRYNLVEHRERMGRLYQEEFLPVIAHVIDVPEEHQRELRTLLNSTEHSLVVSQASRASAFTEDAKLFRDALFISGLLRGRVHDLVAASTGIQIIHHPYRMHILEPLPSPNTSFRARDITGLLANIILRDAFREAPLMRGIRSAVKRDTGDVSDEFVIRRIRRWLDSMQKATRLNLDSFDGSQRLDQAVSAAGQIGIRGAGNLLHSLENLSCATAVFTALATTFLLKHWSAPSAVGVLIGSGLGIAAQKAGNELFQRLEERSLRELATEPGGRIERQSDQTVKE